MNRFHTSNNNQSRGIIILGNSGAGKSYLCNLLLKENRFQTRFEPEAVTVHTEFHRIVHQNRETLVFNIPGLIEVNQDAIDRNKNEIKRAFEMCHQSIVVFIWRETGGRAQNEDVIAFNALNNAYRFPPESLLFVVNNVSPNRPSEFDARFMITLSKLLDPTPVSEKNTLFIDKVNSSNANAVADSHEQLWLYLSKLIPFTHRKEVEIRLQLDEIGELNALLKTQQDEIERDKQALQREIDEMKRYHLMVQNRKAGWIEKLKQIYDFFKIRIMPRVSFPMIVILVIVGTISVVGFESLVCPTPSEIILSNIDHTIMNNVGDVNNRTPIILHENPKEFDAE